MDDAALVAVIRSLLGQVSTTEALAAIRSSRGNGTVGNAGSYFLIGAADQVFEELNAAITNRTLYPPSIVSFNSLRSDERWAPMLRRMGLEP